MDNELISSALFNQFNAKLQYIQQSQEKLYNPLESLFDCKYSGIRSESYLGQQSVYYKFEIFSYEIVDGEKKPKPPVEIERRYTHFEWIQKELEREFFGQIIPHIPPKEYNYNVDKRKYQFVYFIKKILLHPNFIESISVKQFLFESQLIEFQKFVDQSITMKEQQGVIGTIVNTGSSILKKAMSFLSKSPQYNGRIQDSNELEFEKEKEKLKTDKQLYEHIFQDITLIIKKFETQLNALQQIELLCTAECNQNSAFNHLQQLIYNYKNIVNRFSEIYIFRLESYFNDFDRAINMIKLYKDLKDQVHKDHQLLTMYPNQRAEIKSDININEDKIAMIQKNLKKDLQLFQEIQRYNLEEILDSFNLDLQKCQQYVRLLFKQCYISKSQSSSL